MNQLASETHKLIEVPYAEGYHLKTELARTMEAFFSRLVTLCDRKQQDYGSANLTTFGAFGVLVRATDKLHRLRTLTARQAANPSDTPHHESMLDTWADLANYGAIGFLLESGLWPAPPPASGPFIELGETPDGVIAGLRRKLDVMTKQRDEALTKADQWHAEVRRIEELASAVAAPVEPQDREHQ